MQAHQERKPFFSKVFYWRLRCSAIWNRVCFRRPQWENREFQPFRYRISRPRIHRINYPSQQPLRADPNDLNRYFASTAERVTASSPVLNDLTRTSIGWSIVLQMTRIPPSVSVTSPIRKCLERYRNCDRTTRLDQITSLLSLSNCWRRIWSLRSRISSTHALTEMNIPCRGKLFAIVRRFLRWMSHGKMTITDPSLFHLYYLRPWEIGFPPNHWFSHGECHLAI